MKSYSAFGGIVPVLKGTILGLAGLGAVALVGGAMVGGTMVLGARNAPEPVQVASLMPDDLTLPSLAAPEVQPTLVFHDLVWITPNPAQPQRHHRRAAKADQGGAGLASAGDPEWCGKSCAWDGDPGLKPLGEVGPGELVDHRLARQAALLSAAATPVDDTPGPSFGQVVREHLDEVRACWATHGLSIDPGLGGHLTLTLRVGQAGRVERANVARSTLSVPAVDRCIERRAAKWQFPRSGRTQTQSFPLSMSVFGGTGGR